MAGCGMQETFRQALRDCQWQRVGQMVLQGSSLEQRDVAVSQAVSHSQWGLVSHLVQLGISQKCRDLAVHKAVRYCLWDIVDDLVAAGVSSEKRDVLLQRGLRHGQWALVSRLLSLGVGLELRGVVVTTALEHGQWGLVLDALRVGVKQELVTKVFQEVVSQERWEHVPSLVKLFNNNDHTDFVLQEAIRSCQWVCVQQLIKTGLTPAQQGLVCREALEWAHLDCAVELLRQGCEQGCAERIVLEVFRSNRCQVLVDLIKECDTRPSVRDVILRTAKNYEKWYLVILKGVGAKEKEMVDLVTTALHTTNLLVILQLFCLFKCGQRVFKQVLLRTRFSDHDIIILHTFLMDDHPNLAFYMFVSQEMWDSVLGMFKDARVSFRERRFALRHAIRKRAWKIVKKMVKTRALNHSDRRYSFLQAARHGKWRVALLLSAYSSRISVDDKVFAFRMWLKRGLWDSVQDVYHHWINKIRIGKWEDKTKFLKCILEESIIAEKLEPCMEAYFEMNQHETFVLSTAMKYDKCNFVLEFCRHEQSTDEFETALALALEKKKWSLVRDLTKDFPDYIDEWHDDEEDNLKVNTLLTCVGGILLDEDAWSIVVPALDVFCGTLTSDCGSDENADDAPWPDLVQNAMTLTEWCLAASYGNLGLVLSVMFGLRDIAKRVASELGNAINSDVFGLCFTIAVRMSDWDSAAVFLKHLSVEEVEHVICDLQNGAEYSHVMEKCRETDQYKWAVHIGMFAQEWENMNSYLDHCEDTSFTDLAFKNAASDGQWDIVNSLLPRCSQDSDLLCEVLQCAVRSGQSEVCESLLLVVDLRQSDYYSIRSVFDDAVTSSGDREQMVKLCVRFGLATHVNPCNCSSQYNYCFCSSLPMKTALRNGQMPLVKLLYKSGACSENQLFFYKQDTSLRILLQGQGRDDIVEYLDHVATTPRTLQDLCRLQVSRHIGCHPGRLGRVMALEISWPAKDLINFEDVLS
ncbi:uncharacterized protein [Littorina saxatilis]|uniref:Uncharacterized protein n=1 Tax=Littorina saxatilis TaxID=31220 RepID=A0AAN9GG36_9CAEN